MLDASPHRVARPVVEVILELVDLSIDRDHDVQVRGRDVVDETVEQLADLCMSRRSYLEGMRVPGCPRGGCLANRDDELGRRDHVDLPVHDPILFRERLAVEKDADDVRRRGFPATGVCARRRAEL